MPLTIQYVPFEEVSDLDSERKIQKLIRIVKQNKLVLMEGTLTSQEEADLIEETMETIDSKFKGVEITSFNPTEKNSRQIQDKLKQKFMEMIWGRRRGLTIIGPANIVREIRKDPNRIQLFLSSRGR
ncbi:DUF2073 domain-containing protein [Candidatus Woesearchaeota archaeon]|nr:DUF2073 domain-containing protein [Candidatus Woesearchaeota archaeon]